MMLKILLCITGIKDILKYIRIEFFVCVIIFQSITVFSREIKKTVSSQMDELEIVNKSNINKKKKSLSTALCSYFTTIQLNLPPFF